MTQEFKLRCKHHIRTAWYWYVVVIIAAFAVTSFTSLINKTEVPHEKRVDIMMITGTCADYALPYIADNILHSEGFESQEEVTFYYRDVMTDDVGSLIASWMFTNEGDVLILNTNYTTVAAERGALLPLEDVIGCDENLSCLDLTKCLTVEGKIYGIPLSFFHGFENLKMSTTGIYVSLTSYSQNKLMAEKTLHWFASDMKEAIDQDLFDNRVTDFLGMVYR